LGPPAEASVVGVMAASHVICGRRARYMFSAGVEAATAFYAGVGAAVVFSAGVGAVDAVAAAFGAAVVTLLCSTILFQTDSFVVAEDTAPGRISKAAHAEPVG